MLNSSVSGVITYSRYSWDVCYSHGLLTLLIRRRLLNLSVALGKVNYNECWCGGISDKVGRGTLMERYFQFSFIILLIAHALIARRKADFLAFHSDEEVALIPKDNISKLIWFVSSVGYIIRPTYRLTLAKIIELQMKINLAVATLRVSW